jgi:hypothetical protein
VPEIWQMRPADFVQWSENQRLYLANYFDAAGKRTASSRLKPADMPPLPEGTWMYEDQWPGIYGHDLEQLRFLDPADLKPQETGVLANEEGRGWDADRYCQWRREGKLPPPIRVVEGLNGDLRICDGHRRWRAAQLAGLPVPAWVSPLCRSRIDGKPLVATGLTYELALLAAYADGLPVLRDQVERVLREAAAGKYTSLPEQFPELLEPTRPFQLVPIPLPAAIAA